MSATTLAAFIARCRVLCAGGPPRAVAFDLRKALDGKPSLEVRRRLQQLLDQSRDWTPERLRDHRAIQALEHIGTRPVKELLQKLAAGAAETLRTEEAKAALRRLAK
jgi:hypothetical protein